jgi:hypothetical protein
MLFAFIKGKFFLPLGNLKKFTKKVANLLKRGIIKEERSGKVIRSEKVIRLTSLIEYNIKKSGSA